MKNKFQKILVGTSIILGGAILTSFILPLQSCSKSVGTVKALPISTDFYTFISETVVQQKQEVVKDNVICGFSTAFKQASTTKQACYQYIASHSNISMDSLNANGFTIDLSGHNISSTASFNGSSHSGECAIIMNNATHLDLSNTNWLMSRNIDNNVWVSGSQCFNGCNFTNLLDINFDGMVVFGNIPDEIADSRESSYRLSGASSLFSGCNFPKLTTLDFTGLIFNYGFDVDQTLMSGIQVCPADNPLSGSTFGALTVVNLGNLKFINKDEFNDGYTTDNYVTQLLFATSVSFSNNINVIATDNWWNSDGDPYAILDAWFDNGWH